METTDTYIGNIINDDMEEVFCPRHSPRANSVFMITPVYVSDLQWAGLLHCKVCGAVL